MEVPFLGVPSPGDPSLEGPFPVVTTVEARLEAHTTRAPLPQVAHMVGVTLALPLLMEVVAAVMPRPKHTLD
jgi:hypothetical protein